MLKMCCDSLPIRASGSELYSFCSFKSCFSLTLKNGKRTFLRVHLLYNMIIGRNNLVRECDASCEK